MIYTDCLFHVKVVDSELYDCTGIGTQCIISKVYNRLFDYTIQ